MLKRSAEKMTSKDVVDLQLDALFGAGLPRKIQKLVDDELNQGIWVEGYDLAISRDGTEISDAEALLEIVLNQYPSLRIDRALLNRQVEKHLPQSLGAKVSWIVDESGSFALIDSLRVARFDGDSIVWCSDRISFDGIEFTSLTDNRLDGLAWWLGSHESPESPFRFDFQDGRLLIGQVVPC